MFRNKFEKDISLYAEATHTTTYNCTEGGSRIKGAIEIPFKDACKKLLKDELKRPFVRVKNPSLEIQNANMLKAFNKINEFIKTCEEFLSKNSLILNDLELKFKACSSDLKADFSKLLSLVDEFKNMLDIASKGFLFASVNPAFVAFELECAKLYVMQPKNENEVRLKAEIWSKEHLKFFAYVLENISTLKDTLKTSLEPLKKELENRRLFA